MEVRSTLPTPEGITAAAHELREALTDDHDVALLCDDGLDGILCAVGCLFLAGAQDKGVRIVHPGGHQPRLGELALPCRPIPDDERVVFAKRVFRGYAATVGLDSPAMRGDGHGRSGTLTRPQATLLRHLALASATDGPETPQTVSEYVLMGFREGARSRELISDPRVAAVDGLIRYARNECEHIRQFLRFSSLADGTLAAVFRPSADVLPLTGSHFAARMRDERFYVVDPVHRVALLHERGELRCVAVSIDENSAAAISHPSDLARDERYVRAMWKRFYDGMTLQGRGVCERGYDLRTDWMPKRLWQGLTELDPRSEDSGEFVPERYSGAVDTKEGARRRRAPS